MGSKYSKNTNGWTPTKEDGLNTDRWDGKIRINKESKKLQQGQTKDRKQKQTLDIRLNTKKGTFTVYEPGTTVKIYDYDPETDRINVSNTDLLFEYFIGSKIKEKQLEKIKKEALTSILGISENEIAQARKDRLSGSAGRPVKRLERQLIKLEEKLGFKSFTNIAEPKEIAEAVSNDRGKKSKGPNTPIDGKVSANVDIEFSAGNIASRINSKSDIEKTSIVNMELPASKPKVTMGNSGMMRYPKKVPDSGSNHLIPF